MVKSNFNETKRAGITLEIHIARIGLLSLPFKTFSKNYPTLLIVSRILREFSRIINQIHLSFRQRIQVVFFRYG